MSEAAALAAKGARNRIVEWARKTAKGEGDWKPRVLRLAQETGVDLGLVDEYFEAAEERERTAIRQPMHRRLKAACEAAPMSMPGSVQRQSCRWARSLQSGWSGPSLGRGKRARLIEHAASE